MVTSATALGEFIVKIDLEPTSQTAYFTSTFTFHVARCDKFIIVCIRDDLTLSTNLLYSGYTGMRDLNGRKNVNHQTLHSAIVNVHVDVSVTIKSETFAGNLKFVKSESPITTAVTVNWSIGPIYCLQLSNFLLGVQIWCASRGYI